MLHNLMRVPMLIHTCARRAVIMAMPSAGVVVRVRVGLSAVGRGAGGKGELGDGLGHGQGAWILAGLDRSICEVR